MRDSNYLTDEESIRTRTALFYKYVYPHRNLIFHLCIKYTADREFIRDNYNEVLLNFFKYVDSYDESRPVKTWLYSVTVRYIFDLENKKRKFSRTGEVGALDISNIADDIIDEDDQECNLMTEDNYTDLYSDAVLQALQLLKPKYREPFLYQLAGYRLDEITELLYEKGSLKNKNIETIKGRIFLAKKQLRELLTRDGERRKK